jgi:hypothetical protein
MVCKTQRLKILAAASLFVAFAIFPVSAQRKVTHKQTRKSHWRVYSPRDGSFTIETPKPFRLVKDLEYKWLEAYGSAPANESDGCHNLYTVWVLATDDSERPNRDISGLWFLIGGDDIWPSRETDIIVDGRKARDVIYSLPFDSGCKYRRGWIIDGGRRIYLLIYGGDELKSLSSPSTMRFFKSFRLRRKHLKVKRTSNKSLDRSHRQRASHQSDPVLSWPV